MTADAPWPTDATAATIMPSPAAVPAVPAVEQRRELGGALAIGGAIVNASQGEAGALELAGVFANLVAQATRGQMSVFADAMEGQRLLSQRAFKEQLDELSRQKAELGSKAR